MVLAPANFVQIALSAIAIVGVMLTIGNPRLRAATLLMAMTSVWMVFNLLEETAGTRGIWLVTPAFRLAYPPVFYLLIRGLIFAGAPVQWRDWPHALPFLAGLALTPWIDLVEHAARFSLVIYGAVAVWLVRRFHIVSRNRRSDAETIRLRGIYVVVALFVGDTIFDVLRMDGDWLYPYWPWLQSHAAYLFQLLFSLLMMCVLIVMAVRRAAVFDGLQAGALDQMADGDAIDGDQRAAFEQLDSVVRAQALYTEPRLSRAEVAAAAGLADRAVSQLIRAATGRNFNDYINRLRIDDVQAMMREDAASGTRRRILDLAYTAGFSSKSVFNEVFKRETGQTPSAFAQGLGGA